MDRAQLDLSVIIISHGHEAMLSRCVESLDPALAGLRAEVLVVDNLGQGNFRGAGGRCAVPLRIRLNQQPEGFARNANLAVAETSGRFVLILNPDTVFLRGRLAEALAFIERTPDAGVVGCRLRNPDGTIQASCRRFPTAQAILVRGLGADAWPRRPRFYRQYVMEGERLETAAPVDWVLGAFLLLRRSDYEAMGGMDEGFHLYYEDIDLCYRLRERGQMTYYFPEIELMHHHLRSSAANPLGRLWRWHVQSACRFLWKHGYAFRSPTAVGVR